MSYPLIIANYDPPDPIFYPGIRLFSKKSPFRRRDLRSGSSKKHRQRIKIDKAGLKKKKQDNMGWGEYGKTENWKVSAANSPFSHLPREAEIGFMK